jgi:hypothetical protein
MVRKWSTGPISLSYITPGAQLTAVGASTDVTRLSSACSVLKASLQPLVQHLPNVVRFARVSVSVSELS